MPDRNQTEVLKKAKILWEFLSSGKSSSKSDLVVVCGSYDLRVCDYGCSLLKQGNAKKMILSGKTGNWTKFLWNKTEAEIFYERAIKQGVSYRKIILEEKATNLSENVSYSCALFPNIKNIIFITKPNTIKRLLLTIPVQKNQIEFQVDGPEIEFPWGISNVVGILGVIEEMVGDIHRILEYPKKGFQLACDVPIDVMQAWEYLIEKGFTGHMLKN